MNKKKLPKVISPVTGPTDEPAAEVSAGERRAAVPNAVGNVVGMTPRPEPTAASAANVSVRPVSKHTEDTAAWRRARARSIVERHATYSAVGGIIPVPIVNVAGVTAIIVRMVKQLSAHYRVPFERDRTRAIVVGLMGGIMPTGLATVTSTTLAALLPTNLISLAVTCVSAAAFTRGIGLVFVEHFESGATLSDFPTPEGR